MNICCRRGTYEGSARDGYKWIFCNASVDFDEKGDETQMDVTEM
jgi:hypothetical protein